MIRSSQTNRRRATALACLLALCLAGGALAQEPEKPVETEAKSAAEAEGEANEEEVLSDEDFRELAEEAIPSEEEQAEQEEEVLPAEDPSAVRFLWERGFRIERNDKRFRMKIGGRFMYDIAWVSGDKDIERRFSTGFDNEVRRAWLDVTGAFRTRFIYKLQVDLAGNSSGDDDRNRYLRETWIGFTVPGRLNGVRIGVISEPFSMDDATSNLNTTFMERALPNVFVPSYNLGVMINGQPFEERVSWRAGVFRYVGESGDRGTNDLTGRVTVPFFWDDEHRLLHVGASYSHQFRDDFELRYRRRPESHLADRYVDTQDFITDGVDLYGVELAGKWGSASFQGEFIGSSVDRPDASDVDFWSAYLEVSYLLTGEERPYSRRRGSFGRISPTRSFGWSERRFGAWELAARYSHVDLNDDDIRGGELNNFTLGINWYVAPNMRFMGNWVRSHLHSVGNGNIIQFRFQIDY